MYLAFQEIRVLLDYTHLNSLGVLAWEHFVRMLIYLLAKQIISYKRLSRKDKIRFFYCAFLVLKVNKKKLLGLSTESC